MEDEILGDVHVFMTGTGIAKTERDRRRRKRMESAWGQAC